MLVAAARRDFDAVISPPPALDASARGALLHELQVLQPHVVAAAGGGKTMDLAKALTRPGPPALVLMPTTLSGSEHTGNTSWWADGRKVVTRVGIADAVVADPNLLVQQLDVLGPGALHAIAHVLATLSHHERDTGSAARSIVRYAVRDLIAALETESVEASSRCQFMRGVLGTAAAGL